MPEWVCRVQELGFLSSPDELCEGPKHTSCGVRYEEGEFKVFAGMLVLPEMGAVKLDGAHEHSVGKPRAVTIVEGADGFAAEFEY